MRGLYIHIPLCVSRCRYCDFYKVTPKKWLGGARFLDALAVELSNLPQGFSPQTIFIGGGTPSALACDELDRLLQLVRLHVDVSQVLEWSVEVNPNSLDRDKLSVLRAGGANRLSMGIQTFQAEALTLLGRAHTADIAIEAYQLGREMGFEKINIDMIQSVPGLTPLQRSADVDQLLSLAPEHVSYYNLIYEPGTPLTRDRDAGKLELLNDDEEATIYEDIALRLEQAGYAQYEISNFAKVGEECLHNLIYWKGGEYIGCGPSAHSHWQGERYSNRADLESYCSNLTAGESVVEMRERLTPEAKAREILVMWLRLADGVKREEFMEVTGVDLQSLYNEEWVPLIEEKLLEWDGVKLRIPADKRFVSNAVCSVLV
ncbi:MAG: hypothetical protein CBE26_04890 [Kiritimatiellaceae bacterium TMED266]|nr:MAG: hypothetical protein CBE26_04890 [Kiritimatiellaceae bacterium TMED266]